jgi:hypothetical protein
MRVIELELIGLYLYWTVYWTVLYGLDCMEWVVIRGVVVAFISFSFSTKASKVSSSRCWALITPRRQREMPKGGEKKSHNHDHTELVGRACSSVVASHDAA